MISHCSEIVYTIIISTGSFILVYLFLSYTIGDSANLYNLYVAKREIKKQKAEIMCWKEVIRELEETIQIYKMNNKELNIKLRKGGRK